MYFLKIMSENLKKLQQQTQTLPPPYDTNCEDYLSKWNENGGRGPITKKVNFFIFFFYY